MEMYFTRLSSNTRCIERRRREVRGTVDSLHNEESRRVATVKDGGTGRGVSSSWKYRANQQLGATMSNLRMSFALGMMGLVLLTACGATGERDDAVNVSTPGDGVLDCRDGRVSERVNLDDPAMGSSDRDVAEQALADHLEGGGEVRELSPDGSWMVIEGGRDVALVYPEETSDGWNVAFVNVCASAPVGLDSIDGSLDCPNGDTWTQDGTPPPDAVGSETADLALSEAIAPFADRHGGEIVIEGARGSLVSEFDERVVAFATPMDNGTWVVVTIGGCADTR